MANWGHSGDIWGAKSSSVGQTRIFYRSYLICRMFVAIILVSIEIDSLWKAQVPIEGTLEFFLGCPQVFGGAK